MNPETAQPQPAPSDPPEKIVSNSSSPMMSQPKSGMGKLIAIGLIILLILGGAFYFTMTEQGKNMLNNLLQSKTGSQEAPVVVKQATPSSSIAPLADTSDAQLNKDIQVLDFSATAVDGDVSNLDKSLNDTPIDNGQ